MCNQSLPAATRCLLDVTSRPALSARRPTTRAAPAPSGDLVEQAGQQLQVIKVVQVQHLKVGGLRAELTEGREPVGDLGGRSGQPAGPQLAGVPPDRRRAL